MEIQCSALSPSPLHLFLFNCSYETPGTEVLQHYGHGLHKFANLEASDMFDMFYCYENKLKVILIIVFISKHF